MRLQDAGYGCKTQMQDVRLPINTEALCIFRHLGKVKEYEKFRMF